MKDWLAIIAFNVVTIIQIMALLVVAFGTIQAFLLSLRAMVNPSGAARISTGLCSICALADCRTDLPACGRHHPDFLRTELG